MPPSRRLALVLALSALTSSAAQAASYQTGYSAWAIAGKFAGGFGGCGDPSISPDCGDGPDALSGIFDQPGSPAVDAAGNVYLADFGNGTVRRVTPGGALSTMTTAGTFAAVRSAADNPNAFGDPIAVAVSPDGRTLYVGIANGGTGGKVLRVANGLISTYAGSGTDCGTGVCGDGAAANLADLSIPAGLALDAAGNLYIADAGSAASRVRKVAVASSTISTVADASTAGLDQPAGVAVSADGATVYIADTANNLVRRVSGGVVTTIAGSGASPCTCGGTGETDDGPATASTVAVGSPNGLAVDAQGTVFISENDGGRVRRLGTDGTITTIAGGGLVPAPGQAINMTFPDSSGVALDGDGGLVVTDASLNQVFWLVPSRPAGTPGPKGDKGDKGDPGPTGPTGPAGPAGANGANGVDGTDGAPGPPAASGGDGALGEWVCQRRRKGVGRFAVSCFARATARTGARVQATLTRDGTLVARDSAVSVGGSAALHLRSSARLAGVYTLRLRITPPAGSARTRIIRVAI